MFHFLEMYLNNLNQIKKKEFNYVTNSVISSDIDPPSTKRHLRILVMNTDQYN